jgi:hypothetical protein
MDLPIKEDTSAHVSARPDRLIDGLIRPYFKQHAALIVLDGILHAQVEQNPDTSVRKFIQCNVPELLKSLTQKSKQSD